MRLNTVLNWASVALLLTACSSHETERDTAPSKPPPPTHGMFSECLRSHGIVDSPAGPGLTGPPTGIDPEAWDQAMTACSKLAPGPATP